MQTSVPLAEEIQLHKNNDPCVIAVKIWSINHENGDVNSLIDHTNELLGSINKEKFYLSSFGETSEGELLVVDYSGYIYILKKNNRDY